MNRIEGLRKGSRVKIVGIDKYQDNGFIGKVGIVDEISYVFGIKVSFIMQDDYHNITCYSYFDSDGICLISAEHCDDCEKRFLCLTS